MGRNCGERAGRHLTAAVTRHWVAASLLTVGAALGLGCASVSPQPFAAFAESTVQLREGADLALGQSTQPVRERAVVQIVEASSTRDDFFAMQETYTLEAAPESLRVDRSGLPLVLELPAFRTGVYELNTVLVDYAALLHQLALPELVPKPRIEQMAKDLNANLVDAAKVVQPDVDTQSIALFATGAAAATEAWLESTRRCHLKAALEDDAPALDEVARLGREAVELMAALLNQEYDERKADLFRTLAPAPGGANTAAKRKAAEALIALDEQYLTRMVALRTLRDAYAALPKAHAELISAVSDPELTLASITQIYDAGKRLERLHAELAGP